MPVGPSFFRLENNMLRRLPLPARRLTTALGALLAGVVHMNAYAHHSFAMYDQSKRETYTGKLIRFIPGANHAQLLFELVGDDGKPRLGADNRAITWGVELGPAAAIAKQGVTVESFALGTIITVTLNPLRNGKTFGALANGASLIKCGATLPAGGCTADTGEVFLESRN
jgi:hypothetical protein